MEHPSGIPRWETRVIHLNVNINNTPAQQQPDSDTSPRPSVDPVFSEQYLKSEFPDHYAQSHKDPSSGQASQKPVHPALQLQNVFNQFGADGWEFIGIFPVGSMTTMIFKRPLLVPSDASDQSPNDSVDSSIPTNSSNAADIRLERLEALVANLTQQFSLFSTTHNRYAQESVGSTPSRLNDSVPILSSDLLSQLSNDTPIPTSRAAGLLGYRSPASLLNFASRHNFQVGITKRSLSNLVAIYFGEQVSVHGGRPQRLWKVITSERFDALLR